MTEFVTTTVNDRGVATVTLNNPAKHNAFDDSIIRDLTRSFDAVNQNADARLMVLASAGKNFSAGADLNWMKRMTTYSHGENLEDAQALAEMLRVLNFMGKPTIARVQGGAYGGAVGLISCCDMAVALQTSTFSLSEVKIGLIPATISPYVVSAIGQRASRRYFNTAERFTATEALRLGLISELADHEQGLDKTVNALIDALLGNGPAAIASAKQLIFDVADREVSDELIDDTCQRIADIRTSPEGQEGLSAFLEKRAPDWAQ